MNHPNDERLDGAAPEAEQEAEMSERESSETGEEVGEADLSAGTEAEEEPEQETQPPVERELEPQPPFEVDDEPVADAEPVAEPGPELEPSFEPEVEPEPEPEPVFDPEPVADVVPEPEPASDPDAELVEAAEPEPEPEASPGPPTEVEPALVAAVDEALEGIADETDLAELEEIPEWVPGEWYVVHTYAGYENKVKADLETRVASMNMEDKIYEVVIPMEEVVEVKSGKKQKVQRKVFPGYLLVRLDLDDESWYVVRNTPGVTGFVGSGSKPTPLSEREVDRILQRGKEPEAERPKPKLAWTENDPVRVTSGPFANFQGVISEVDGEREKVKVLVNIFGRETPVELNFDDIQKV